MTNEPDSTEDNHFAERMSFRRGDGPMPVKWMSRAERRALAAARKKEASARRQKERKGKHPGRFRYNDEMIELALDMVDDREALRRITRDKRAGRR